ncbi:LuxR C-terminal-related transcriptional regulator [Variovorax boronicumulans]|uniref:LuxR C-terminal-related transcriptional regulator n=1 Tax=Variovorax boronicumulans TaxID=436515 RepID=UPI0012E43017|nr:response regulator transcription factor [Variovorax boronicumulans]GER10860.1 DNA-binding response regulator [Variovorax boronicumulans]
MKVMTLDDHALFRAGLRMLLESMERSAEIFEAATVDEACALALRHPDLAICLLDLELRGEYGLDALVRLKAAAPDIAAVVVSASTDVDIIRGCLEAGAMSFVPKSMPADFLKRAFETVLAGEVYLPQEILRLGSKSTARPTLSPRQADTLHGLARGLPTKSIARELGLSEHTVKEYIGTLFQALGVHNRTEAVITGIRLGLLSPLQRKGS